jgi:hypothetical protein
MLTSVVCKRAGAETTNIDIPIVELLMKDRWLDSLSLSLSLGMVNQFPSHPFHRRACEEKNERERECVGVREDKLASTTKSPLRT